MPGYRCATCGRYHDNEIPMAVSYFLPDDVYKVPRREQPDRIKFTTDLCSIDDEEFYIRGIVWLPVKDGPVEFQWGLWAAVSEVDFEHYVDLYGADIDPDEPPIAGRLANELPHYDGCYGLEVEVVLQSGGLRPKFIVLDAEHPLAREQGEGITMERVHEFAAPHIVEPPFERIVTAMRRVLQRLKG